MQDSTRKILKQCEEIIENYFSIPKQEIPTPYKEQVIYFENFLKEYRKIIETVINFNPPDHMVSMVVNLIPTIQSNTIDLGNLYKSTGKSATEVYSQIQSFVSMIYSPTTSPIQGQTPYILFAPYFLFLNQSNENTKEILNQVTLDLTEKRKEMESLISNLQEEASKISISNYAAIFETQATSHSSIPSNIINIFKYGAAEKWLILGFASLSSILYGIYSVDIGYQIFNLIYFDDFTSINQILMKGTLLAILLYITRFSFNNYKINKNLYIANSHRQNILNSFRMLFDSLPNESNESKSKLMELVSASIFGLGKNPYEITNKNEKIDLNAIAEVIKISKT